MSLSSSSTPSPPLGSLSSTTPPPPARPAKKYNSTPIPTNQRFHLAPIKNSPSNQRCPFCQVSGEKLENHIGSCQYEPVYCESKCGMKIPRKLHADHDRRECTKRPVPCPYCLNEFVFDTLKNHIPKCPRFVAECPPTLPSKDPNKLPLLPCVFKDIGCKFKGNTQALDHHLDASSKSHLALMCAIVSRQQSQISALRSALHSVTMNTTGTLLWKIPEFSSKLNEAKSKDGYEVCSPPFLTSAHGYRLQASLFLNGNGSGEGSHLSVYIKILPGEFDALLRWPFSLTVSFTMIDQPLNPDKACHIVESFVPDPTWKNFQRPSKEPDALGFGFPRFVSHEMLKKCHYLRDDTLFIKVKVDESKIIAV